MLQNFVELPEPLQVLLLTGVTFVVTQFLKWLSGQIGTDLSGYGAQVSSAIVASVLVLINALLAQIPAELEAIANALLNLVVVILGSWGAYKFYRTVKPKQQNP
jgi:hypothetical protein